MVPKASCSRIKRDVLAQRLGRNYNQQFMAEQATLTINPGAGHVNVTKRDSSPPDPLQWTCQTTTTWEDLGQNFYPRFLRKTTCSSKKCWFDHFSCKAKTFDVKILKRKPGKCNVVLQSNGKPTFEDHWELVEKKVAYCCECGH